jgi:hypothetical protein
VVTVEPEAPMVVTEQILPLLTSLRRPQLGLVWQVKAQTEHSTERLSQVTVVQTMCMAVVPTIGMVAVVEPAQQVVDQTVST